MRTLLVLPLSWLAACAPDGDADPVSAKAPPPPAAGGSELVTIPAGTFEMGCDPAKHSVCNGDEAPVHEVQLSGFGIERTEVTVGQWMACMDAGRCKDLTVEFGPDDHPVLGVTVEDAGAYCAWLLRRLPTEAEWERAARGTDGRLYPWGDDPPDCDKAASRPCDGGAVPVGSHPAGASPDGVLDMAGNAWEWVADWYAWDYNAISPDADPDGAPAGGLRVVRGSDGWSDPAMMRVTNREMAIPDGLSAMVGFRCAVDG